MANKPINCIYYSKIAINSDGVQLCYNPEWIEDAL